MFEDYAAKGLEVVEPTQLKNNVMKLLSAYINVKYAKNIKLIIFGVFFALRAKGYPCVTADYE